MKLRNLLLVPVVAILGCDENAGGDYADASTGMQTLTNDCVVYVDEAAEDGGSGTSWEKALTSVEAGVEAVSMQLDRAEQCEIVTRGIDVSAYKNLVEVYAGKVTLREDSSVDNGAAGTTKELSAGGHSNSTSVIPSSGRATVASPEATSAHLPNSLVSTLDNEQVGASATDYVPYAACACDSFSGRVDFTSTADASGSANTGVIEINDRLRIDNNEIITNTNSTLYLQSDNNGDLRVDGGTLSVDASADRVGIGTTSPTEKLDVNGSIAMSSSKLKNWSNSNASGLNIEAYAVRTVGAAFTVMDSNSNVFAQFEPGIDEFSVDGTVHAKELILEANIADYVFQDGYDLAPLDEVEAFIKENNHLPDMPSEKDVSSHGLSIADFNTLLLQKIEELTLHLIEQNKEIRNLKKEVASNR